jgi:hypothetical protein
MAARKDYLQAREQKEVAAQIEKKSGKFYALVRKGMLYAVETSIVKDNVVIAREYTAETTRAAAAANLLSFAERDPHA